MSRDPRTFSIFIYGSPAPQGSKRHVGHARPARLTDGKKKKGCQ